MKRYVVAVWSVAFFLAAVFAFGEVTLSDVVRWGLMRKADVLAANAQMRYSTTGVLRVTESYRVTDTNAYTLTVREPFVYVPGVSSSMMATGVYSSLSVDYGEWETVTYAKYFQFSPSRPCWMVSMEGCTSYTVTVSGEGVTNTVANGLANTNFYMLRIPSPLALDSGGSDTVHFPRVLIFTNLVASPEFVRVALVAPQIGGDWGNTNVATNATSFVLYPLSGGSGQVSFTNLTNMSVLWKSSDDTYSRFGWAVANSGAPWVFTGSNTVNYAQRTVVETNDFVSATALQDAIDDLRQEITEAIEAHVELLHPE